MQLYATDKTSEMKQNNVLPVRTTRFNIKTLDIFHKLRVLSYSFLTKYDIFPLHYQKSNILNLKAYIVMFRVKMQDEVTIGRLIIDPLNEWKSSNILDQPSLSLHRAFRRDT
jgi:hypothetical protein